MKMFFDPKSYSLKSAQVSACGKYRHRLTRSCLMEAEREARNKVCWIMLNPSTADEFKDDPTVRKCIGFTSCFGYPVLEIVNLFDYRLTNPAYLGVVDNPVGPRPQDSIRIASKSDLIVFAWGAHPFAKNRAKEIIEYFRDRKDSVCCLGKTKEGHPRHPLMVSYSQSRRPFYE